MHRSLPVVFAFACAIVAQKPPSTTEIDALIPKFLSLDHATSQGHTEANELLNKLATLPPLDASQLAAWNAKIHKAWSKGRKLEKAGDNWFWPEDKKAKTTGRGRYIIGRIGHTSSGPGPPEPIPAILPHPRALVQPVTPARFGLAEWVPGGPGPLLETPIREWLARVAAFGRALAAGEELLMV